MTSGSSTRSVDSRQCNNTLLLVSSCSKVYGYYFPINNRYLFNNAHSCRTHQLADGWKLYTQALFKSLSSVDALYLWMGFTPYGIRCTVYVEVKAKEPVANCLHSYNSEKYHKTKST
ncbi:unnamed protein product [Clavelina lepadiformis]|uniref:Uncharacterized protein n=1 Tax=Clavelina lepadiformis TaxID=159417 RepID=A0ABP0FJE5_CLALP